MRAVNKPNWCKCGCLSPFVWYTEERPSIFATDVNFAARGALKAKPQAQSEEPPKQSAEDRMMAILRLRTFTVYNRAGAD